VEYKNQNKSFEYYRHRTWVGSGGMAEVYRGYDPDPERRGYFALKILSQKYANDPDALERFRHEAAIHTSLVHPSIVRAYDFVENDERPFLVLEYINSGNLAGRISELRQPLDLPQSIALLAPVCEALDYAHNPSKHIQFPRAVFHCDVKPGNILIEKTGRILLSDFGIAQIEGARLTVDGAFGAASYMAPEQCSRDWGSIGPYTDVYALGVVLYELLTLRRPFYGTSAKQGETTRAKILWEQQYHQPRHPLDINDTIAPWLDQTICRALQKDPLLRQQSPFEFLDDITYQKRILPATTFPWKVGPAEQPRFPSVSHSPTITDGKPARKLSPWERLVKWRDERAVQQMAARTGFIAYLDIVKGEARGNRYWIGEQGLTLGRRSGCDIVMTDKKISRLHARFVSYNGQVYLRDMESQNGTLLNGERVFSQILNEGDEIVIGDTAMRFHGFGKYSR
jgi:serine/threonine protein kinase